MMSCICEDCVFYDCWVGCSTDVFYVLLVYNVFKCCFFGFLSILSIIESGKLMSPTLVLELSITDFISVSFYYFGALLLSKSKFIILISSRWIDPFIIFPSFYFQSICIFESKMDPLQTTYSWIMFFIQSDSDWFFYWIV